MAEQDLEHLLGGFATETLTPEEQQALYRAALQDQRLFNALADEQALKELLADPAVRRTLLEAVRSSAVTTAPSSQSWLDWVKRPAGWAWAGGLVATIVAVVFSTRIFDEEAPRQISVAVTDEAAPAARPAPAETSPTAQPELEARLKRPTAPPRSPLPGVTQDAIRQEGRAATRSQKAPAAEAFRQDSGGPAAPPALPAPSTTAASSAAAGRARTLFYGPAATTASPSGPTLGLRYSFVRRDANGQERNVGVNELTSGSEPARLRVEANREAYLQVLKTAGTAGLQLWWPQQDMGKISLKLSAHQPIDLPLPAVVPDEPLTLTLRLGVKPFGPLTRQEAVMLDRDAVGLLTDTSAHDLPTESQEQATYVVRQDSSPTTSMTVAIPIAR